MKKETQPKETYLTLECPRCGGRTQTPEPYKGRINCGDCLMERTEIVKMLPYEQKETTHEGK